jgi:parallel beta-helix repeat protein
VTVFYRVLAVAALAVGSFVAAPTASGTSGTLVVTANTVLTEDHHGYIAIQADNVTLDCAGHAVLAPDPPQQSGAIEVFGGTGVTIKRCEVVGSPVNGIYAGDASNSRYEANVLRDNTNHGIHLDSGSGNFVVDNTSRDNGALGIVFTGVVDSEIRANVLHHNANWAGVALFAGSQRVQVIGNTARENAIGFLVESESNGNTLFGNTAQQNQLHGVALTGSTENVLANNTSNGNGWEGFFLNDADDNELIGNAVNRNGDHASNVFAGIALVSGSSGNLLDGNTANGNADEGFVLEAADANVLTRNVSNANGQVGFETRAGSSNNTLHGNTARSNAVLDAFDDLTGTGNVWANNNFGTTEGV